MVLPEVLEAGAAQHVDEGVVWMDRHHLGPQGQEGRLGTMQPEPWEPWEGRGSNPRLMASVLSQNQHCPWFRPSLCGFSISGS